VEEPGEDGYALLAKIRALGHDDGGDVPVLALTALAGDEDGAAALRIAPGTVRAHVRNAMRKLEVESRTQAVAEALRRALIE